MTMVSSGPISLGGNATSGGLNQSINIELGQSATAQISLNDANVRTLLGVSSGAISLSNAYGKANQFAFTISSNQTNANLRSLAVNAGWNQSSAVVATINAGIFISGSGGTALTINGSFPGGVSLVNNGTIAGNGGNGGSGGYMQGYNFSFGGTPFPAGAGNPGGLALAVSTPVSITNNGTIAGGGGGGGGGGSWLDLSDPYGGTVTATYAGGGGGGGRSGHINSAGGPAGGGNQGGNGIGVSYGSPGGAGTSSSAGSGGIYSQRPGVPSWRGGAGGNGGNWGSGGSTGQSSTTGTPGAGGGAAGAAITGNSNITWVAFGTRLGSIS